MRLRDWEETSSRPDHIGTRAILNTSALSLQFSDICTSDRNGLHELRTRIAVSAHRRLH